MKRHTSIRNILTQIALVLGAAVLVLQILDIYNPLMGFVSGGYYRTLLALLCVSAVAGGIWSLAAGGKTAPADGPRARPWAAAALDLVLALAFVGGWFGVRVLSDVLHPAEPVTVSELAPPSPPAAETAATPAPAPEATPEATPDPRTEWQIRFAEHFTEDVVITEDSYSSPNLSVTVTRHEMGEGRDKLTWYLADIYMGSIDCFRSELARTPPTFRCSATFQELAERSDAVVAVNGDYIAYSYGGVAVRNGVVWSDRPSTVDMCLLYRDGVMECVHPKEFDMDAAAARDVWQVWSFGPGLLGPDGALEPIPPSSIPNIHMTGKNPRTAIGYFEPGHYCFVVADGRQPGYSRGARLEELSQIFHDLGCKAAFNLDGGGSSMMSFRGETVTHSYNRVPRRLSDIVLIADAPPEG